MELHKLRQIIARYNAGNATTDEKTLIEQWYESIYGEEAVLDEAELRQVQQELHDRLKTATGQGYRLRTASRGPAYRKWVAAACLLLAVGAGLYYYRHNRPAAPAVATVTPSGSDLAPGRNRATLTLADGSRFILENTGNGTLARQNGASIHKDNGELVYHAAGAPPKANAGAIMNTMTTPRGGAYAIVLTDGSKIWLNAASSLRFPAYFAGADRTVELQGEAYFEIAPDAGKPFHVIAGAQTIDVLGTHFNISNYNDESTIITTLTTGSIRVRTAGATSVLEPGQQSLVSNADVSRINLQPEADTGQALAWQHNLFQFNNADIGTIMRQLSRWYDVEVVFEGPLPREHFSGKISRNVPASGVPKILAASGINFKIEGRKIILK
ncbi:MAG TPA: FecR domain-containing protein [Chitinophaga sp.]